MYTKRCLAPIVAAALVTSLLPLTTFAQWSSDPASNLSIGDGAGDQVQPKIAPTSDGGCFISWYSNFPSGYDVRLQRLNAQGEEMWTHNGILIADRAVSSTVDYSLVSDGVNAVIVFNDDRVVPNQITAQKVDPAGNLLWNGAAGVNVGLGSTTGSPATIARLSDGGYGVIWNGTTSPTQTQIQKLDANGALQWTPQLSVGDPVAGTPRAFQASDVQADNAGGMIVLFVRCNGSNCATAAKHLYVQKYNSAGVAQWNAGVPMAILTSSSIQTGNFPRFLPDGDGGGVFAWAEIGATRQAQLQHVESDGTLKFGTPISAGNNAGRGKLSAAVGYNAATGDYFVGCSDSSFPTQGNYTYTIQRINSDGELQWGPGGYELIGGVGNLLQASFGHCQPIGNDGVITSWIWQNSSAPDNGLVYSARIEGDLDNPTTVWSVQSGAQNTNKSRLFGAWSQCGFVMLGFGQGGAGNSDAKAQNVRTDGTFGNPPPLLGDLDCDGTVDVPDINPFIQAVMSPAGYAFLHPCCDINNANMNGDAEIDGLDVTDFVAALLNP